MSAEPYDVPASVDEIARLRVEIERLTRELAICQSDRDDFAGGHQRHAKARVALEAERDKYKAALKDLWESAYHLIGLDDALDRAREALEEKPIIAFPRAELPATDDQLLFEQRCAREKP